MISMTSWKNRLRRMLFLDKLQPLVGQTLNVAEFEWKSAIVKANNLSYGLNLNELTILMFRMPRPQKTGGILSDHGPVMVILGCQKR